MRANTIRIGVLLGTFHFLTLIVNGQTDKLTADKGDGYPKLHLISDGDGTNNNSPVSIRAYGKGGTTDLFFKANNWTGSYLFQRGASDGTFNQARIRHGGGGGSGTLSAYGIFELYGPNQIIATRFSGNSDSFILNGSVGIGTSSPQGKMEIRGTTTLGQKYRPDHAHLKISSGSIGLLIDSNEIYGNDALLIGSSYSKDIVFRNVDADGFEDLVAIKPSGNVGIGTNSPKSKLNVSSGVTGDAVLMLEADIDNNNEGDNARIEMLQDGGALGAFIGFDREWGGSSNEPDNLFRIGTRRQSVNNFNRLVINTNTGNVGVGTDNPTHKLSVNGTIRSKEIICEVAPWPDYVFEAGYELQPLSELKTYIEEEGHLPGIPSAQEVQENGVTLAKMNALLLEKIEELTLHVIRLEERLEAQQ